MTMGILKRIGRIIGWLVAILAGIAVVAGIVGFFVIRGLIAAPTDKFGTVEDEAMKAGMTVEQFSGADEPFYVEMDKGLLKEPAPGAEHPPEIHEVAQDLNLDPEAVRQAAIRGQNMWIAWTGGNDRFWDFAARTAIGSFDLLKTVSSHPSQGYGRNSRFRYLGLINEPCFEKATGPNPERFGLWLDARSADCGPDPFANATKYPGAKLGARDTEMPEAVAERFPGSLDSGRLPVWSHYGQPTGVMGLRLFPNPDFDAEAATRWDPLRFYEDPSYYYDKNLVRPYRVGMSCAFCHVGPNPINPPKDVEEPTYAEMNSNPGAQYYWVDRVFFWNTRAREEEGMPAPNEGNFLFQLFHTNPPGALDTSLVSTDYMNNPRTMNAIYETRERLRIAAKTGIEQIKGGEVDNKQFQDFPAGQPLASYFDPDTGKSASMRVLKDGADSVGTLGALNRVYLNIGLFSEEWLLHFRPFLGGQHISPIKIADAQRNSVYWQATEANSIDMAVFFLVTGRADKLADAQGGDEILAADDPALVERGKVVFAQTCAACHSSRQPDPDPAFEVDTGICEGGGSGPEYRECWDRYWAWAQSDDFKSKMTEMVLAKNADGVDAFLIGNYLSTERRVPMDLLGVNACTPTATNGLRGDIWDNFTSDDYKSLPPPGAVTVHHPVSGGASSFQALGNGRGYLRPASLVSLWATAPYLSNNALGYAPHYYGRDYYADVAPAPYGAPSSDDARPVNTSGIETTNAEPEPRQAQTADRSYGNYASGSCPSADPYDPNMPCIANRVHAFETGIRALLSPELRRKDDRTTEPVPGYIYRTSAPSCLIIPPGFSPDIVRRWSGLLNRIAPWAVTEEGGVEIGPFPEGFPVNALVNTKLLPDNDDPDMAGTLWRIAKAGPTLLASFRDLGGQCSTEELADPAVAQHAETVLRERRTVDTLVGLSKCPDYVVNKGHDFGAPLGDGDREALIAYLKRF